MIRMYHSTTRAAAEAILAEGFRDFRHDQLPVTGVWLSRDIFTVNEGAKGHTVLEVMLDMTEDQLAEFAVIEDEYLDHATGEWVKDPDFQPREWLLTAQIIRERGTLRLLGEDENPYEGIGEPPDWWNDELA